MDSLLGFTSLFFFSLASAGFIYFLIKYPRSSQQWIWGIRTCHFLGFLGVAFLRLNLGRFSDNALLIISSLLVSLVACELSQRYLQEE